MPKLSAAVLAATFVFSTVTILAACSNPNFCEGNVNNDCREPRDGTCESTLECEAEGKVCDIDGSATCVQCTTEEATACGGTTPLCRANTCAACTADSDCDSKACLGSGACVPKADIAYVQGTPSTSAVSTQCTLEAPCSKLSEALALQRPYIKLSGSIMDNVVIDRDVVLLGEDGAKISPEKAGALVEIKGSSKVEIYNLELSGITNTDHQGILMATDTTGSLIAARLTIKDNAGIGISINGGTTSITRSLIANNLGGGLLISGAHFDVTSSFIVRNGSTASDIGGAKLMPASTTAPTYRFEFNTIVDNQAKGAMGNSGGVRCNLEDFVIENNILARNRYGITTTNGNSNHGGLCDTGMSFIDSDVDDLSFAAADVEAFDYHLLPGSKAIDLASVATALADMSKDVDWDGEQRPPQKRDVGADEYIAPP